jgi:hypothetical protein
MSKEDQMVQGYLEGLHTFTYDMPDKIKQKSLAYQHGWLSGRDDAFQLPREDASVLKARAEMILNN